MATLYVRDMPDDLYARLRAKARETRRSIGATAIELLRSELSDREALSMDEYLERSRAARRKTRASKGRSIVEDLRADRSR